MKKRFKITLITSISLVIILFGAFFIYASDYYKSG